MGDRRGELASRRQPLRLSQTRSGGGDLFHLRLDQRSRALDPPAHLEGITREEASERK